jgi:hypothetical protein
MARRLSVIHKKALQTHHEDESNWDRWKFMESLRRNFFFVHMINILESKVRKLNESYFEPLGDQMILKIPLPAPESMWRACSSEEWLLARARALGCSSSDGSPGYNGYRGLRTLEEVLQAMNEGQVDIESLLPLVRMVLASTIISPPEASS